MLVFKRQVTEYLELFFLLYIIYYDIWDLSGVYKGKGTESQN